MTKTFQNVNSKGILIKVPEQSSDYSISVEYHPYSVWLHMNGRLSPMPIGNLIYPYKHNELRIDGTMNDADGKWLVLADSSTKVSAGKKLKETDDE